MTDSQRGFTLVELSIVLVILGLLVGGVLTGQSLIRAAELRSITTQYQRYMTATQAFRDKYFALPGDMANAQSYWGVATNCPGTSAQPSTDAKTCNGDGNGQIDNSTYANEWFRFWQHLANAGLIEGSYVGVTQGSTVNAATTANVPAGRISSSLWFAQYTGTSAGGTDIFAGEYGNILFFGGTKANTVPINPIIKPEEIYNIDMKMDDGKPATGRIVMEQMALTTCSGTSCCTNTSTNTNLAASYLLTNNALACNLIFRQAF